MNIAAMKQYLKSLISSIVRKMYIKIALRFHFTSVSVAIVKNDNRWWHRCCEMWDLISCWGEYKLVEAGLEISLEVSSMLEKISFTFQVVGTYPKDSISYYKSI